VCTFCQSASLHVNFAGKDPAKIVHAKKTNMGVSLCSKQPSGDRQKYGKGIVQLDCTAKLWRKVPLPHISDNKHTLLK